jgi:hypothetical protein
VNFSATKFVLRTAAVAVSLATLSVVASAQTKPTPAKPAAPAGHSMDHGHDMKEPATGWKELDAFHELMAASWHPAKGQNDLKPAKAKAADLAKAAKTWSESQGAEGLRHTKNCRRAQDGEHGHAGIRSNGCQGRR